LSKVYQGGTARVVDGLDLEIKDKEFVVLVGPSGCGKSTTLRMIAGLEEVSEGRIWIGDRLVNDVPAKDRDIAMVFQNYALYPHMSVFENMAFGLKLRKYPKAEIEKRVHEAAEILNIHKYLNRRPRQLSGGEHQRVALGRAIVRKPKVFLFDEPLSNLDAKMRVTMRTEIHKLRLRLQTTFIYVTHDQTEAMTMADRVVLLRNGRIEQVGSPAELYGKPQTAFAASFIGAPPMNLFPLERRGEGWYFAGLDARAPCAAAEDTSLGVRPEEMDITSDGLLPAVVETVEYHGADSIIAARAGASPFLIRVPRHPGVRAGDHVRVTWQAQHQHLFSTRTGERIPA
jgi:multiple sugar transport system ATP-binding protein